MRSLLPLAAMLLAACQAGAALGTACERNDACASPLVCRLGRCRNECVAQRDCPIGSTCLLDGTGNGSCALLDDPDCSASGGSCAAPLACVGRECVNVCTLGPECPSGSECVPIGDGRARCVRTDGVDAGLPLDAGASDAQLDAGLCTPEACDTPLSLAVGDGFTCVRPQSGRIWCWGDGRSIGRDLDYTGCTMFDTTRYGCSTPAPLLAEDATGAIGPTTDFDHFDAQDTGGCYATHTDSLVRCWGTTGSEAPLGRDVLTGEHARLVERQDTHAPLADVDRVFVFTGSAIAVTHAGLWWGWGNDAGDVLVRGAVAPSPYAIPLSMPLLDTTNVVTAPQHGCGIDSGQRVWCWGSNDHGESDPSAPSPTPVGPTLVAGVDGATALVLGDTHSCAVIAGGLRCWGWRQNLWLDADPACAATLTDCPPTQMPLGSLVIDRIVPIRHADDFCAIDVVGMLYCWGGGYTTSGHVPQRVPDMPAVASAAVTWTHGCAITTNSQVYCWGLNDNGELGRLPLAASGAMGAAPVVWP